jgi:molybdopterin synthase catalytic subunit
MLRVTRTAIALDPLLRAVRDPAAGAVVTFVGTTRNENAGRRVIRLEYEAYAAMAVSEMRALAAEAARRWPLRRVAMVHRTGRVPIGQASVAIAVSAGHRREAFAACHWLIDRLKEVVPIWKREHYRGGVIWIGAQQGGPEPPARRRTRRRRAARRAQR